MKELTAHTIDKQKASNLFVIIMLLFCLLPVLINCLLLAPLYTVVSYDVAYPDWLATLMHYAMDLIDIIAFSVPYSLIIFSVLLLSKKTARTVIFIYIGVFLLQIPLRIFMNIPLHGTVGSVDQIIIDIIYLLVYFVLYVIQLMIVYFFATTDCNRHMRRIAAINTKRSKRGKSVHDADELPEVLPLSGLYSRFNPLQHSALKMGLLILAVHVLTRVINDIDYGMPQSAGEIFVMIAYYLSDIIYGVIAYFIALFIFTAVYDKLKKKTADGDEPASADSSDIV